ncbi:MAG: hypothetical protein R3Y10_01125, partial [Ferrimonas sp.]
MAASIITSTTTITNIIGTTSTIVVDTQGVKRTVNIGDTVYAGEKIITDPSVSVKLSAENKQFLALNSKENDELEVIQEFVELGNFEDVPVTSANNNSHSGHSEFTVIHRNGAQTIASASFNTTSVDAITTTTVQNLADSQSIYQRPTSPVITLGDVTTFVEDDTESGDLVASFTTADEDGNSVTVTL